MSLTATEAAAILGIHPKTLRQKLRDGIIKGHQVDGNTWVVEESDVESYASSLNKNIVKFSGRLVSRTPNDSGLGQEPQVTSQPQQISSATPSVILETARTSPTQNSAIANANAQLHASMPDAGGQSAAWLLLAVGDDRAFGSNDGYDDEPECHYKWDSTVPNHSRISVGDAVVLWDKKSSIGASIVESIDTTTRTKPVYSCPNCGKAHIKSRKTKTPRYRCFKCHSDFEHAITTVKEVVEYTSTHGGGWVDLSGALSGSLLRSLCDSPKSQLSLRPLKWEDFKKAVAETNGSEVLTVVEASQRMINGGHKTANVRVRIGQDAFRRSLLEKMGSICAFTGKSPTAALEAAHLYSYAKVGEHHEQGGFLMRRDLHRLFDLGLIAIHPETLTIDVSPSLLEYPTYQNLQGLPLTVAATAGQADWLKEHWAEHRQ